MLRKPRELFVLRAPARPNHQIQAARLQFHRDPISEHLVQRIGRARAAIRDGTPEVLIDLTKQATSPWRASGLDVGSRGTVGIMAHSDSLFLDLSDRP